MAGARVTARASTGAGAWSRGLVVRHGARAQCRAREGERIRAVGLDLGSGRGLDERQRPSLVVKPFK